MFEHNFYIMGINLFDHKMDLKMNSFTRFSYEVLLLQVPYVDIQLTTLCTVVELTC